MFEILPSLRKKAALKRLLFSLRGLPITIEIFIANSASNAICFSVSFKKSSLKSKSSGGYPVKNISENMIRPTFSDFAFLMYDLANLKLPSTSPTFGFS